MNAMKKYFLLTVVVSLVLSINLTGVYSQEPATAEEHFKLGLLSIYQGHFDDAIENLTLAIELDENHADAYFWRGIGYRAIGSETESMNDLEKAIELYTEAIEQEASVEVYIMRGRAYVTLDDEDLAEADWEQAVTVASEMLEADPNDVNAYTLRGVAYFFLDEYAKARDDLTMALELDDEYVEAYYWRGRIEQRLDKIDEALANYELLLELDPERMDTIAAVAYALKGTELILTILQEECPGSILNCGMSALQRVERRQAQEAVPYLCTYVDLAGETVDTGVQGLINDLQSSTGIGCPRN